MKPLKIMLADLYYSNELNKDVAYVPLNIGYVGAYAKASHGKSVEISLYKDPKEFIDTATSCCPDLIGLSLYFWNEDLTKTLVSLIKERLGDSVVIAAGGPSVDTDAQVQLSLFKQMPGVNALIPDDGEVGFANLINFMLEKGTNFENETIDGAVIRNGNDVVTGKSVGPSLDLSTLPSPYLTGLLDKFLVPPFKPIIQTNRGCPSTCKFCAAGRDRHKIRQFPLDQIEAEISFLSEKYKGEINLPLFIADLNFGIFKRDKEIARFIRETSMESKYPACVDIYTEKGFSEKARSVMDELGDLNASGWIVALQSENKKTLEAVRYLRSNRRLEKCEPLKAV